MPDSFNAIRALRWSTRWWTFQEAMLSRRRRLVFTAGQVYFECNAMSCYKSMANPLDKTYVKNLSKT
jgi:hypothetical protein